MGTCAPGDIYTRKGCGAAGVWMSRAMRHILEQNEPGRETGQNWRTSTWGIV